MQIRRSRGGWEDVSYTRAGARDARGLGVHDLVEAIAEDRPPRVGGLAAHVVDVATSILVSGERESVVTIQSEARRPDALPNSPAVQIRRAAER